MKDPLTIQESELDGALNALFLDTYSQTSDEALAGFFLAQEYNVAVDESKEKKLIAKLNGNRGGKNILWIGLGILLLSSAVILYIGKNKEDHSSNSLSQSFHTSELEQESTISPGHSKNHASSQNDNPGSSHAVADNLPASKLPLDKGVVITTPQDSSTIASIVPPTSIPIPSTEKELPYFNKEGLNYFAKIKERILEKFLKIDDLLYGKTAPGSTKYKNEEVIVPPFVMSNFPVTNLQYKAFLADLVTQGRYEEMKKCLPKEEVWKEYNCNKLAKDYFSNEIYNDFPVVNVDLASANMFCEWMQAEFNMELDGASREVKSKFAKKGSSSTPTKKKQVVVRLPYDYEWIYSVDAAYSLIPNCSGYNTIYDPSEGLVDKGFYKRTSQVSKLDKSKETKMDKLSDVNRFGMTEVEMIEIFKKAINYKNVTSKSAGNSADPASYPDNIEACCLAGHVCELIKNKEGELVVRGCCWQNKDEYLKMVDVYKKRGASPFIGFRVLIMTTERGKDKNPFW